MNELFSQLFGQQPSYAPMVFGDEAERLRRQAQQQGLLNLGLSLLSGSGPSAQPRGIGQLLAQGVQAGQQAYQGAYNKALQDQMLKQQLQQQQQAQREQQMAQAALPQVLRPATQTPTFYGQPTQMPLRDDEGNIMPGAGVAVGQPQIDMNTLQQLLTRAPNVAGKVLPTIEAFRKMTAPEAPMAVGLDQTLIRPTSGEVVYAGPGRPEKPAGEVLEAMQILGINVPVGQLSPDQRKQIQTYIDRKEERKAPKVSVDLKDPTAVAKAQQGIVSDWRSVMKDVGAFEIADRYQSAVSAVAQGNAGNRAADGALIYSVGKLYDPSGAVQEGDKQTILGNRSIPDSVKALANRVFNGGDLLPKERQQLLDVVTEQVKARAIAIERQKAPYISISRSLGGDGAMLQNPLTAVLEDKDLYKKYGLDRR